MHLPRNEKVRSPIPVGGKFHHSGRSHDDAVGPVGHIVVRAVGDNHARADKLLLPLLFAPGSGEHHAGPGELVGLGKSCIINVISMLIMLFLEFMNSYHGVIVPFSLLKFVKKIWIIY